MDNKENYVRKHCTITDSTDGVEVGDYKMKGTFPLGFWESWVFLTCGDFESVPGDDKTNYGRFVNETQDHD